AATRYLDPFVRWRRSGHLKTVALRPMLLTERQAVPHVQQRFLVHRLVFEDGEDRFGAIEERMPRLLDLRIGERIDHLPVGLRRELFNHGTGGPCRLVALGPFLRIDAAGEERLEPGVDARATEPALDE